MRCVTRPPLSKRTKSDYRAAAVQTTPLEAAQMPSGLIPSKFAKIRIEHLYLLTNISSIRLNILDIIGATLSPVRGAEGHAD